MLGHPTFIMKAIFKIGVETRLSHFTLVWKRALGVALAGMFLPLGLGTGAGLLIGWSLRPKVNFCVNIRPGRC